MVDGIEDETDWTNVDAPGVQPYVKSKAIAERAARDWVAAEGGAIEYCAVCPVLVLGPVMGADFAASVEPIQRLLDGSVPALPDVGFSIVDLRDIAQLHVLALEAPADKVAGGRFIGCSGPFFKFAAVAKVLRDNLVSTTAPSRMRSMEKFERVSSHLAVSPASGRRGPIRSALWTPKAATASAAVNFQPANIDCTISKPSATQSMHPRRSRSSMAGSGAADKWNTISGSIRGSVRSASENDVAPLPISRTVVS